MRGQWALQGQLARQVDEQKRLAGGVEDFRFINATIFNTFLKRCNVFQYVWIKRNRNVFQLVLIKRNVFDREHIAKAVLGIDMLFLGEFNFFVKSAGFSSI